MMIGQIQIQPVIPDQDKSRVKGNKLVKAHERQKDGVQEGTSSGPSLPDSDMEAVPEI